MSKLVKHYGVGENIEKHDPKHIAEKINKMLSNNEQIKFWKANAKKASQELNWEKESGFLQDFLKDNK